MPEIEKTKQILVQHDKEFGGFNEEIKNLNFVIGKKQEELKTKENKESEFRSRFKSLFAKRNTLSEETQKNDIEISRKQDTSRDFEIKDNTLSIKNAEVIAQLSALNQEFERYHGIKILTDKPEEELKKEISRFEKMREEIGSVNMRALEIYEDVEKEYNNLLEKKDKLENEKKDVLKLMEEIETKKKSSFMETLDVVNNNFKSIFTSLSKKGDAYLVLENKENPFEAGLRINVKITSNKFLDIRSLSGGEKTLTALAFIFAIQEHDPASFYILDEVDAALDKKNSETFAKLIRSYSDKAQYLIISHNDAIVSEADNLYGISMDELGVSKAISLRI